MIDGIFISLRQLEGIFVVVSYISYFIPNIIIQIIRVLELDMIG